MATNPFGGFNQSLQDMQSTMLTIANLKRQEKQDEQASKLSAVQMQRAQQDLDTGALSLSKLRGEQRALIDQYGTEGQTDPYGRALSFQAQEEKDTSARQKVLTQAKDMVAMGDPKGAIDFYNKAAGTNIVYQGAKDDFLQLKDEQSGNVVLYNWRTGESKQIMEGTPKPDPEAMIDKRFANQQKLQNDQIAAQDRRTAQQIAAADRRASGGGMGKLDFESGKALVKGLPKLKEEAIAANGSVERIDTMLNLVKGGVGGKKGQLLSTLAPYAEMVGVNTKTMNEAQTYEIMAKTIGGSMRMQIVGPGPVSNYENQLLQKISGGGSAATPAATELLTYYRKMAKEKVDDYNGSVDAVSEFSPATKKIYRKIGGAAPPAAPASSGNPGPKLSKKAQSIADRY